MPVFCEDTLHVFGIHDLLLAGKERMGRGSTRRMSLAVDLVSNEFPTSAAHSCFLVFRIENSLSSTYLSAHFLESTRYYSTNGFKVKDLFGPPTLPIVYL